MNTETRIRNEIHEQLEKLKGMTPGSEEHKATVNTIKQLTESMVELQKAEDEKKDRKARNRLTAWGIGVPAGLTFLGGIAMFIFEERGTITSQVGRKVIDRLFRLK